jgi:hypothetical protein
LSPDICPPPRATTSAQGYNLAPASFAYSAACSTRAAATRRSALCAIASATAADNCSSEKVVSQLSAIGCGAATPPAAHSGGTCTVGSPCSLSSTALGGFLTRQPNAAISVSTSNP